MQLYTLYNSTEHVKAEKKKKKCKIKSWKQLAGTK